MQHFANRNIAKLSQILLEPIGAAEYRLRFCILESVSIELAKEIYQRAGPSNFPQRWQEIVKFYWPMRNHILSSTKVSNRLLEMSMKERCTIADTDGNILVGTAECENIFNNPYFSSNILNRIVLFPFLYTEQQASAYPQLK